MSSVVRCLAAATLLVVAGGCGSDGDADEGGSSADPDPVEAAVESDGTTTTAEAVGDSDLAREISRVLCAEESYYCGIDGLKVVRQSDTLGILTIEYVFTDGEHECTERTDFQEFDDGSLDTLTDNVGYQSDCGGETHPIYLPSDEECGALVDSFFEAARAVFDDLGAGPECPGIGMLKEAVDDIGNTTCDYETLDELFAVALGNMEPGDPFEEVMIRYASPDGGTGSPVHFPEIMRTTIMPDVFASCNEPPPGN